MKQNPSLKKQNKNKLINAENRLLVAGDRECGLCEKWVNFFFSLNKLFK